MGYTVSRRSLIGALGAGMLLSPVAGADERPAAELPGSDAAQLDRCLNALQGRL